jgi:hypothetical protein
MNKHRRLTDAYRFTGYTPQQEVIGVFGDPIARVIRLKRIQKKQCARVVASLQEVIMTTRYVGYAIFRAATNGYILSWKYAALIVGDARK